MLTQKYIEVVEHASKIDERGKSVFETAKSFSR